MNVIFKRQSIRKFTVEKLTNSQLTKIVEAGLAAPSSKNLQPWQMIVVTEREILDALAQAHANWRLLAKVQQAIIVVGDLTIDPREPQVVLNAAAATQNMLLQATNMEIGSVWLGAYPDSVRTQALQTIIDLPPTMLPISVIALGHYDASQYPDKVREIDTTKIHWNKW